MTIIVIGNAMDKANMTVSMNEPQTIVKALVMNSTGFEESSVAFLSRLIVLRDS